MAITINGTTLADGAPLLVGGVQASSVTVNGTEVWVNTVLPSAITDFACTDGTVLDGIVMTWTNATGIPAPTYDLYHTGDTVTPLLTNIVSGYTRPVTGGGGADYFIRAVNSAGSVDSNIDTGYGGALPSAIADFVATDDQVEQITMTWSSASGVPTPTYDLYQTGDTVTPLTTNITSGYVRAASGGDSADYFLRAVNTFGATDSNTDIGSALYILPGAIADFTASLLEIDQITVTFSAASDAVSYDLYSAGALIASSISSGYIYATTSSSVELYVKAINPGGSTDSNTSTGTTREPAGSITYNADDTFVAPRGYTAVTYTVYGCGGGGGGGRGGRENGNGGGGGLGGAIGGVVTGAHTVVSGSSYAILCPTAGGAGGAGAGGGDGNYGTDGIAGASVYFDSILAGGGAGGLAAANEAGGCGGDPSLAGTSSAIGTGGASAPGGSCNTGGIPGNNGGLSAGASGGGGGGGGDNLGDSGEAGGGGGIGGGGQVSLSWA